jgi:cyclic pyranopterin phosphate synthase
VKALCPNGKVGMVDISDKKVQHRTATAMGKIILKPSTIQLIKAGQIKKGDPIVIGETAALVAIKQTPLLIPMCHQIPIAHIEFGADIHEDNIEVLVTVKTTAQTGVEMEALIGVTNFLNVIWDMTKYLEKDSEGQYPTTQITEIRVVQKKKSD